jgi:hypothetical protein
MVKIEDELKEFIMERKSKISPNSLKAYVSTLKNLFYKVYPKDDFDLKKFSNTKTILTYLKDVDSNKRKSILAALLTVCVDDKCDDYRKVMMEDSVKNAIEKKAQKKSDREEENWVEDSELMSIIKDAEDYFNDFFKMKAPTMQQYQKAQNFVILALTTGKYGLSPRRSLDWVLMKWRNSFNKDDNIFTGKDFIFNKFKTVKYLGVQKLSVPLALRKILTRWVSRIPDGVDTILFDTSLKPLTNVTLNQRLGKIFGKKVSTSMLRHFYVTNEYKNLPALQELSENAEAMGHSLEQHLEYIKK